LLLYEPFDYPNIGGLVTDNTPANWTIFGAGGPNDLTVVSGSLSASGLATPVGNSVEGGGAGPGVRRLFSTSVTGGRLYFSALFRINDIGTNWNGASSQVGALTATDNISFRCAVMVRAATGGYNIGVQKGGMGATATFGAGVYQEDETIFLVGKYDFTVSPNPVSLWINPDPSTFGAAAEPAAGFLSASTGTDGLTIDRFNMRQNTATSVPAAMQWDELRIGGRWSDVTPPPPPVPTDVTSPGDGTFRFRYSNGSGRSYSVHATTNLNDWLSVGAGTLIAPGVYQFIDPAAFSYPRRFYQLRSP